MSRPSDQLKADIAFNERVAEGGAVAVVVGLAFEIVFAAAFHEPPETRWSHWGPVGSDVIVALGVAVEVLFGRRQRLASDELSRLSEQDVAAAMERASIADKKAADANERAAVAEQSAADAFTMAEKLRQQSLEFEEAISPRLLEQRDTVEALRKFSGELCVVISPIDFEIRRAAGQIRWVLHSAGWKILSSPYDLKRQFFDGVVVSAGVDISAIADTEKQQHERAAGARRREVADELVRILNENGFVARRGPPETIGAVVVEVGPKPLPPKMALRVNDVASGLAQGKVWGNILDV